MAIDLQGYASRKCGWDLVPSAIGKDEAKEEAAFYAEKPERLTAYLREMGIPEDEIEREAADYMAELNK